MSLCAPKEIKPSIWLFVSTIISASQTLITKIKFAQNMAKLFSQFFNVATPIKLKIAQKFLKAIIAINLTKFNDLFFSAVL